MPPRRSSSRSHQPAQRRPRTGRACHFCRMTKQRCDSSEYGTNDRPCRRCVSQGLTCSIPGPQAAHSQSPSSGFGAQGFGPVRHRTTPRSAGGATEELTPSPETNVQHALQQSGSVQVPMEEWPSFMMRPDEQQGPSTSVLSPGQTQLQMQNFFPPVPSMEGYPQSLYYYGQTTSGNTYMTNYAIQGASDGAAGLGLIFTELLIPGLTPPNRYAEEPQPDNEGAFADEEDASYSRSDEF
ncbi:hypothetical protein J3R82DRAFT_4413 [Butyriboletus roseoflavus]|nr:hypothetical protein J3R82DRAFT_4413 [Butyriboletus roseoflavus]